MRSISLLAFWFLCVSAIAGTTIVPGATTKLIKGATTTVIPASAGTPSLTPTVAWLKFDDGSGTTAADSVDSHTGTLTDGGGGLPTWTSGHIGGALSFPVDGYVGVAGTLGLASVSSEITLACWVNIDTGVVSGNGVIFGLRASGGNPILLLNIGDIVIGNAGTGKLAALLRDDAGGGLTSVIATTVLTKSVWHHVALTRNSSQVVKIYLDGVLDTSGTDTDTMTTSMTCNAPRIAFENGGDGLANFIGLIDDVRVYNTALSATDIAALAAM